MLDRLEQIEARYEELGSQLADPEIVNDQARYQKTAKAHRDLEETVDKYREYKKAQQGIADAKGMLNESDPELAAMAREELAHFESRVGELEEALKVLLCRAIRTTRKTSFSRFAPAPAATKHRSSPPRSSACIRASPNSTAGKSRFFRPPNPASAASKK